MLYHDLSMNLPWIYHDLPTKKGDFSEIFPWFVWSQEFPLQHRPAGLAQGITGDEPPITVGDPASEISHAIPNWKMNQSK